MTLIPQRAYLSLLEKGWKPIHVRSYSKMNFTTMKPVKHHIILAFEGHSFESDFPKKKAMEILGKGATP